MATATRRVAPAHQSAPGPDAQAQAAAAAENRARNNRLFLERSPKRYAVMPQAGGSGLTQNYGPGSTLIYDVPTSDGAYLDEILLVCTLTNTLAGTGATFQLNAGAPYTVFDSIEIQYGGTQSRLKPYILKTFRQMAGWLRGSPASVLAGNSDAETQAAIWSTFPVATAGNAWTFYLRIPVRLFPHMAAGMLPIQSDSTKAQVKVICAPQALGNDPILNCVSATAGTGLSSAITGTVQAISVYRNGERMSSRTPLELQLDGEPTAQAYLDRVINPLGANIQNQTRIDTKMTHMYGFLVVVDAQNATKFADRANITGFAINQDMAAQNKIRAWGRSANNNVPMNVFWEELRGTFGQDFDEGIIPVCYAPQAQQYDPSNGLGLDPLEMGSAGWPDANIEVWLNTIGNLAGVTPRAELYLFSLNSKGLVRQG